MKVVILVSVLAITLVRSEDGYDARYDNFNVDEVIDNGRLLKAYAHCFIGDGNCTPDGNNFKKWIPDAVQTNCAKCSDKQKVMVAKVIKALMAKHPEEWKKLVNIHDPDRKRTDELAEYLKQYAA